MDFLQFLGTISPSLAPTLLISYLSIRLILEFLKERRELLAAHQAERKEWREALDTIIKDTRVESEAYSKAYTTLLSDTVKIGRDLENQMHNLKGEITKYILAEGKTKLSGGGND